MKIKLREYTTHGIVKRLVENKETRNVVEAAIRLDPLSALYFVGTLDENGDYILPPVIFRELADAFALFEKIELNCGVVTKWEL